MREKVKQQRQKLYNTEVTVIYSRRAEGICEKYYGKSGLTVQQSLPGV